MANVMLEEHHQAHNKSQWETLDRYLEGGDGGGQRTAIVAGNCGNSKNIDNEIEQRPARFEDVWLKLHKESDEKTGFTYTGESGGSRLDRQLYVGSVEATNVEVINAIFPRKKHRRRGKVPERPMMHKGVLVKYDIHERRKTTVGLAQMK